MSTNPEFRRFVTETGSAKDKAAFEFSEEFANPRREYKEGELRLDYRYRFSTGEVFTAHQDEKGVAILGITKKDGSFIDFSQTFLSQDFKFVTPTYLKSEGYQENIGDWFTHMGPNKFFKFVSVGDMRRPESIFSALHEAAHTHQEPLRKELEDKLRIPLSDEEFFKPNLALAERYARGASILERNAWVKAIYFARQLKREHGVGIIEIFPTLNSLKKFIYAGLIHHRLRQQMYVANEAIVDQDLWQLLGRLFGYRAERAASSELKKKLFDKGKYEKL